MNTRLVSRRTRHALAGGIALSGVVVGLAAGIAPAGAATLQATPAAATTQVATHAQVHPDGWATVVSCTGLQGSITFSPGLAKAVHKQSAFLSATLSGCVVNGNGIPGTGTLTAALSGKDSVASQAMSGSFTVSWPAASGLNPSTGSVSIIGPTSNVLAVGGSGTSGAYTGAAFGTALFLSGHTGQGTAKHRITNESFVASQPLTVRENLG